jgi:hypothetical protein
MDKVERLRGLRRSVEGCLVESDVPVLREAIDQALQVTPPGGEPELIQRRAEDYRRSADLVEQVRKDIHAVGRDGLPKAWRGTVAESAAQAVTAFAEETSRGHGTLGRAARTLADWSDQLDQAQRLDRDGVGLLQQAEALAADPFPPLDSTKSTALDGVDARIGAAENAQAHGTATASMLRQLAAQARAERVTSPAIDPLGAVELANSHDPGGPKAGDGEILTPYQLERGSSRLDGLSPADQRRFRALLAHAKSPQEAAYLWKVLAAGHDLDQVERFDHFIHSNGGNPTWLSQHLTPQFDTAAARDESREHHDLLYQGQTTSDGFGNSTYSQNPVNDCVPSSLVVARARVDPTVMLQLTTGHRSDTAHARPDHRGDSAAAFHDRLQKMYIADYRYSERKDGADRYSGNHGDSTDDGTGPAGEKALTNRDLAGTTGEHYHRVSMDGEAGRRAALPGIEQAVDEGRPVPIALRGTGGHQVIVIGHDGNRLEVYSPWGFTTWVTEDQFAQAKLDGITHFNGNQGNDNRPAAVELPS